MRVTGTSVVDYSVSDEHSSSAVEAAELVRLKVELTEKDKRLQTLAEQNTQLVELLAAVEKHLDDRVAECKKVKIDHLKAQQELHVQNNSKKKAEAKISHQEETILTLQEKIEQLKKDKVDQNQRSNADITSLLDKMAGHIKERYTLQEKLHKQEAEMSSVREDLEDQRLMNVALASALDDCEKKCATLEVECRDKIDLNEELKHFKGAWAKCVQQGEK